MKAVKRSLMLAGAALLVIASAQVQGNLLDQVLVVKDKSGALLLDHVFVVKDKSGAPLLEVTNVQAKGQQHVMIRFWANVKNVSGHHLWMKGEDSLFIMLAKGRIKKLSLHLCASAVCDIPAGSDTRSFSSEIRGLPKVMDSVNFVLDDSWEEVDKEEAAKAKSNAIVEAEVREAAKARAIKEVNEEEKQRAACAVIYTKTIDRKTSDLTVRETEQVKACQLLGFYY